MVDIRVSCISCYYDISASMFDLIIKSTSKIKYIYDQNQFIDQRSLALESVMWT